MAAPNNKEVIHSGSPPQGRDLAQALVELQNLSITVLAGAAADADLSPTGFSYANDTIVAILHFPASGDADSVEAIALSEVKAGTDDGDFQLDTTVTTGGKLVVVWFNKGAL
jgi:hypothetical protein